MEPTRDIVLAALTKYASKKPEGPVDATTPLDTLGVDSLAKMEIVFDLEEKLGIVVPDPASLSETERAQAFATVGGLTEMIERLVLSKPGTA
jgi:acyl carrier protein